MNIIKHIIYIVIVVLPLLMSGQNLYNQKNEYGYKGAVKKVTTYMVSALNYRIPTDTVDYFGKSTMNFTKKGDVTTYNRFYNLPTYKFTSKAVFSGSGKNITYKETSIINDTDEMQLAYKFVWTSDFDYKIQSTNENDLTNRFISLNSDFTVDKVLFKGNNYESLEQANYHYNLENQLEKIIYKVTVTENGSVTVTDDVRVVKSVDVFNNATVIYFYEKEHSRFPKSVVFKYYEYY